MKTGLGRRDFLRGSLTAFGALVAGFVALPQTKRKPNIVLFLADDLGWKDLGCQGSGYYETPNLDKFAKEGVRLTDAHSGAANCSPSRACLLSGQYVPRHGVYTVSGRERFASWQYQKILPPENASGLAHEKITLPEALKSAGYTTGMFGKWHVTWEMPGKEGQYPTDHGFDEAETLASAKHFGFKMHPETEGATDDMYLSDYLADRAMKFMEKNRDKPFFLYLPDFLVHVPLQAKQALLEKYKKKQAVDGHGNPAYGAMIEALDYSFGRVAKKLDELGIADNTLIVFYSDNGGVSGTTSNLPLKGTKGQLYEGGIRVPLIMRWPGVIKPGTVCDLPAINQDLYPTFVEAAGGVRPDPKIHPLDGTSLLPVLRGESMAEREIHWWMPGYLPGRQAPAHAMRLGDYKLIEYFEDNHLELYNLKADIGESTNLAETDKNRAQAMRARMKAWRTAIGAEIPPKNPNYNPAKLKEVGNKEAKKQKHEEE